jgi:DNA-binding transcriptional regulator YiaG
MAKPIYRSRRLEVLHKTSADLHRADALDDSFMRELDAFCLAPTGTVAPADAAGQAAA